MFTKTPYLFGKRSGDSLEDIQPLAQRPRLNQQTEPAEASTAVSATRSPESSSGAPVTNLPAPSSADSAENSSGYAESSSGSSEQSASSGTFGTPPIDRRFVPDNSGDNNIGPHGPLYRRSLRGVYTSRQDMVDASNDLTNNPNPSLASRIMGYLWDIEAPNPRDTTRWDATERREMGGALESRVQDYDLQGWRSGAVPSPLNSNPVSPHDSGVEGSPDSSGPPSSKDSGIDEGPYMPRADRRFDQRRSYYLGLDQGQGGGPGGPGTGGPTGGTGGSSGTGSSGGGFTLFSLEDLSMVLPDLYIYYMDNGLAILIPISLLIYREYKKFKPFYML